MKNISTLFLVILFFGVTLGFAQKVTTQTIEKPTEGKSLVYITNMSGKKFDVYDDKKLISNIKAIKYITTELESGKHLFWIAKNPSNYIEADLSPNGVYVLIIEQSASVGAMFGVIGALAESATAGGRLRVLNPQEFKDKRLFYQIIKNFKKVNIEVPENAKDEAENTKMFNKVFEKYDKFKQTNDNNILYLTPEMKFENADKPIKD